MTMAVICFPAIGCCGHLLTTNDYSSHWLFNDYCCHLRSTDDYCCHELCHLYHLLHP